jgi:hypothetical protein
VREVPCPQCGEYLGVPVEFERGPIRCGSCSRVIQPHEHSPQQNRTYDDAKDDDPSTRNTRLDDDGRSKPRRSRRPDDDEPRKPRTNRFLMVAVGWMVLFGVVCCGCGGFLVWEAFKPSWEPYSTAEFTVTFPKPPTYSDTAFTTAEGKTERLQQYLSQLPLQQQAYVVMHTPLPKGSGKVWREAQMNAIVDELKKGSQFGFQETKRTNMIISGQQGMEVEGTGLLPQVGKSTMVLRLVPVEKRMFILVAVGRDRGRMAANMQRFFDSFIVSPSKVQE